MLYPLLSTQCSSTGYFQSSEDSSPSFIAHSFLFAFLFLCLLLSSFYSSNTSKCTLLCLCYLQNACCFSHQFLSLYSSILNGGPQRPGTESLRSSQVKVGGEVMLTFKMALRHHLSFPLLSSSEGTVEPFRDCMA